MLKQNGIPISMIFLSSNLDYHTKIVKLGSFGRLGVGYLPLLVVRKLCLHDGQVDVCV